MHLLTRLSTAQKINICFGLVMLLIAALGSIAYASTGTLFESIQASTETGTATAALAQAQMQIIYATLAALIVTLLLAVVGNTSIARPIRAVAAGLQGISDGNSNLSVSLKTKGSDELAQIGNGFNTFMAKLRKTISEASVIAEEIATEGQHMSGVASAATQNTSQQRDEIEQLASAITELASTVQEVARSATSASQFAQDSDTLADEGVAIVTTVSSTINELAAEVQRAGDVIGKLEKESATIGTVLEVIRDIAEQTNLLALNATIESARAGEHGRGFAVVADEVRTLASKTHESTEEIQEMIAGLQKSALDAVSVTNQSGAKAELAVEQSGKARATLENISSSMSSIHEMNLTIASSAEEQSSCAAEISRNVEVLNDLSGKNTVAAREVSDSSNDMLTMATKLAETVGRFRA